MAPLEGMKVARNRRRHGRSLLRHDARRLRGRRHQGRALGHGDESRNWAPFFRAVRCRTISPRSTATSAAWPSTSSRRRAPTSVSASRLGRRADRQFPARRARPARPRLRGSGADNPTAHLLLASPASARAARCEAARQRRGDAGVFGRHEPHRRAGRRPGEDGHLRRRHRCGHVWRHRHADGARSAAPDGARPARRYVVARGADRDALQPLRVVLRQRASAAAAGSSAQGMVPYQAFQAADDWMVVAVFTDRMWRDVCAHRAASEWADDLATTSRPSARRTATRSLPRFTELFRERPVAIGARLTRRRRAVHPRQHHRPGVHRDGRCARDMIVEIAASERRPITMAGLPIKFSDTPGGIGRPPPLLGEHTGGDPGSASGYPRRVTSDRDGIVGVCTACRKQRTGRGPAHR